MCDNMDAVLEELGNISAEPPKKRLECLKCSRPVLVCFCSHLTSSPIEINNRIVILQHPSEEKRCLRTAKILELSLSNGHCLIMRGKKFTPFKYPMLKELVGEESETKSILMYPGLGSKPLEELSIDEKYNIIIIDGTWSQSRSIYHNSSILHKLPKIELNCNNVSNYVIRTQPTDGCLSTVETAALVLSHLENDSTIYNKLTNPLKALCDFQLERGAVSHHSKEFLIKNNLYTKPLTKRIKQKLCNKEDIKQLIR